MKPNAEEFAKHIILHLVSLRLEVEEVNTKLEMVCGQLNINLGSKYDLNQKTQNRIRERFLEALREIGISTEDFPQSGQ